MNERKGSRLWFRSETTTTGQKNQKRTSLLTLLPVRRIPPETQATTHLPPRDNPPRTAGVEAVFGAASGPEPGSLPRTGGPTSKSGLIPEPDSGSEEEGTGEGVEPE